MLKSLVVLLLVAASAFAADVAGAWQGSLETPMGSMEIGANLKVDGSALAGTLNFMGNDTAIEKGKIDGDKISFEVSMQFGTMAYAGTISGDELKLTLSVMGNEVPLTLKRVKKQ
jgi:hypothetical protein